MLQEIKLRSIWCILWTKKKDNKKTDDMGVKMKLSPGLPLVHLPKCLNYSNWVRCMLMKNPLGCLDPRFSRKTLLRVSDFVCQLAFPIRHPVSIHSLGNDPTMHIHTRLPTSCKKEKTWFIRPAQRKSSKLVLLLLICFWYVYPKIH